MQHYCTRHDKVLKAGATARAILDVAQARGASRARLLRGTGIFEEDLNHHYTASGKQLLTLLHNAQAQSKSRDTAFQIGKSLASSHLPQWFSALGTCQNLADAMRIIVLRRWVFSPFISVSRFEDGDDVLFVIEDAMGCGKTWPFVVEMYLALWVSLCKLWYGQRMPFHFAFTESRPRHIQEFEEHLGYRLTFDAPLLSVRIKRSELSAPFAARDRFYRTLLWTNLRQDTLPAASLLDTIRRSIRSTPALTQDEMAARLGMSPATLKRKLKEHETSFRLLSDETRRAQAVYLLSVQKMNNEQSAVSMAFSDLTNFRRAVKRWTGQTPSELRGVR